MAKFEHDQLLNKLTALSTRPEEEDKFNEWIEVVPPILALIDNLNEDEYIACAESNPLFIQTAIVSRDQITDHSIDDLLGWGTSSIESRVHHNYMGSKSDKNIYLEKSNLFDCQSIDNAPSLVFHRTFEGVKDESGDYYEILQEFAHISGIHWRDEHNAYCKFDANGNWDSIVSISKTPIKLVTINRKILDEYLYATNSVIVRVFEFDLLPASFHGWNQYEETIKHVDNTHYKQGLDPSNGSCTHGFQIITPKDSDDDIYSRIYNPNDDKNKKYVEFIAHDWRNKVVCNISTDPSKTTNYFQAKDNNLPFELSPAFFKPEVLSRYKADKDKYTITPRSIECRSTWYLRSYDINTSSGQVHAYICDLRKLPYQEQVYWSSFSEKPRAGISKRAFESDFQASWSADVDSLDKVKRQLEGWTISGMSWWQPTEPRVFENVTRPLTGSKDEWADAFMELSKLIAEGFRVKPIRKALDDAGITYNEKYQSIKLLELLCEVHTPELSALKEMQMIRTKFKGHSGASAADEISKKIIKEHGGYPQHFNAVCDRLLVELDIIEFQFSSQ